MTETFKHMTDLLWDLWSMVSGDALFLVIVTTIAALSFRRAIADHQNPIRAWHFYSSRSSKDGQQYGDPDKLAKMMFAFFSTIFVGYVTYKYEPSWWTFATFSIWAIAMLGINLFASWARTFVDHRFGQAGAPEAKPEVKP